MELDDIKVYLTVWGSLKAMSCKTEDEEEIKVRMDKAVSVAWENRLDGEELISLLMSEEAR